MNRITVPFFIIFTFVACHLYGANGDSVLIAELKKFIVKETGFNLDSNFYAIWSRTDKPYVNLYISLNNNVESPYRSTYSSHGTNEERAKKSAAKHEALGHHTFIYKTYATSAAQLNNRFMSYPTESKCFIMLHEFIHHFKRDLKLSLPIEFEEALGDVVGNYGAMEFVRGFENSYMKRIKDQTTRNENIYRTINRTADLISRKPENVNKLNNKCQKQIEKILTQGDVFQKDRFGYDVNNAYLLKNRYYSEKYFLLKKLFQKRQLLVDFLNIIKTGPSDPGDFEAYIKSFL